MLSLTWPKNDSFVYPKYNFGGLGNLLRLTSLNKASFDEYIDTNTFVVPTDTVLGGVLRHLAIDGEWELEYVIQYARLRSYSLSSLFKITSISNSGSVIRDGFYREGTLERWVLIENDKTYSEANLTIDSLSPLIPLYSTTTKRGYKPNPLKLDKPDNPNELAILAVDVVELAIGWWLYMKQPKSFGTGIESYLVRHVYNKTQLYQNQLSVINTLFEFFINGTSVQDSVKSEYVTYTTLNENKLLVELIEFVIKNLTNKKMTDLGHVIASLPSLYYSDYSNFVDSGKSGMLAQSCWIWEPPILKMYAIYLSIANMLGYKASDINITIERVQRVMARNLERVNDSVFRNHLKDLSNLVFDLNDLNYK